MARPGQYSHAIFVSSLQIPAIHGPYGQKIHENEKGPLPDFAAHTSVFSIFNVERLEQRRKSLTSSLRFSATTRMTKWTRTPIWTTRTRPLVTSTEPLVGRSTWGETRKRWRCRARVRLQYQVIRRRHYTRCDAPKHRHMHCPLHWQIDKWRRLWLVGYQGSPAQFAPNRVIRGWTIALQLMSPGDKWLLTIPSDLAYGEKEVVRRYPQIRFGLWSGID